MNKTQLFQDHMTEKTRYGRRMNLNKGITEILSCQYTEKKKYWCRNLWNFETLHSKFTGKFHKWFHKNKVTHWIKGETLEYKKIKWHFLVNVHFLQYNLFYFKKNFKKEYLYTQKWKFGLFITSHVVVYLTICTFFLQFSELKFRLYFLELSIYILQICEYFSKLKRKKKIWTHLYICTLHLYFFSR